MRELLDPKTDWGLLVKERLGTRFRAQVHLPVYIQDLRDNNTAQIGPDLRLTIS